MERNGVNNEKEKQEEKSLQVFKESSRVWEMGETEVTIVCNQHIR